MENDDTKRISGFSRKNGVYKLVFIEETGLYELVSPTFSVTLGSGDLLPLANLFLDGQLEYERRLRGLVPVKSPRRSPRNIGPKVRERGVMVEPEVVRRR